MAKLHDQGGRSSTPHKLGRSSKDPTKTSLRRTSGSSRTDARPSRTDSDHERERERLERKYEEQRQRAIAAEREQAEILSVVSHDVRNPLSAILVSAQMLARIVPPGAEGRRQLDAILRGAEEINHVIQDLLDATSIEAGSLMMGAKPYEIPDLVDAAFAVVGPSAAQKPLSLHKELAPDLPRVLVDRDRTVQALSNLLGNAVKFTPKDGQISLRAEPFEGGARFAISDTGPGIPADQLSQLFVKYAPRRGPSSQGSGLAVFVAKGIIDAHGGRMWAESKLGEGSTFFFTLPGV